MCARWLSARSLLLHVAAAVWVSVCALAAWWQVTVALSGDRLGYLYSVEWPCFAVFGIVVWWHALHDDVRVARTRAGAARRDRAAESPDAGRVRELEQADPGLARYNAYLERLAERPREHGWRRP
ncbi:MAG TPA: hypothetical protein VND23_05810 [Acidimicrobiales bacterium]|nr:hypothetical protein [Acidimicrobiales bacterium]